MTTKTLLQLCGAAAVVLLPLSTSVAQAADPAAGAAAPARTMLSVDERLAQMKKTAELTDDQVAKLKAIYEQQKTASDPIRNDASLSKDQKREKLKPIMDDTKTKVNAVLTPEQQAKVEAARKERREKRAGQ